VGGRAELDSPNHELAGFLVHGTWGVVGGRQGHIPRSVYSTSSASAYLHIHGLTFNRYMDRYDTGTRRSRALCTVQSWISTVKMHFLSLLAYSVSRSFHAASVDTGCGTKLGKGPVRAGATICAGLLFDTTLARMICKVSHPPGDCSKYRS
jgi:hypothetical protein